MWRGRCQIVYSDNKANSAETELGNKKRFQILSNDGPTYSDQNSSPSPLIILHSETITKLAGEGAKLYKVIIKPAQA